MKNIKNAFTLIEIIVVIGMVSVILTLTTGVLLSTIRSSERQDANAAMERNGDFALKSLESELRTATSVKCVNSLAVSGACGPSFNFLSITGNRQTIYYGRRTSSSTCKDSTTITNGFIFRTTDAGHLASGFIIPDGEKLTNDSSQGVNFTGITFSITGVSPQVASITLDVVPSGCESFNTSRSFNSLVTLRGSYQ